VDAHNLNPEDGVRILLRNFADMEARREIIRDDVFSYILRRLMTGRFGIMNWNGFRRKKSWLI
jgi:hypothetical protein